MLIYSGSVAHCSNATTSLQESPHSAGFINTNTNTTATGRSHVRLNNVFVSYKTEVGISTS